MCAGPVPGPLPSWAWLKYLNRVTTSVRLHLNRLLWMWRSSDSFTNVRVKSWKGKKNSFQLLASVSCSFGHCPQIKTLDDGRNTELLVNREPCSLAQLYLPHTSRTKSTLLKIPQWSACRTSFSSHLILKFLCLKQHLTPFPERAFHMFLRFCFKLTSKLL